MRRQVINIKWVALTDLKVKIGLNARQGTLAKAWTTEGTLAKWAASSWAKRLAAQKVKAGRNDFQRFQLRVASQKVAKVVRASVKA